MIGPQLRSLRLPDLFTLLGILSAAAALFFFWNDQLIAGYFCILAQIGFDILDGRIARVFHLQGKLGVQLDNFGDLLAILATTVFGYTLGLEHLSHLLILGFFLLAAAIRLAYFTAENAGKLKYFTGVPTTFTSACVSTILILNFSWWHLPIEPFLGLYLLFGVLMISSVRIHKP